MSHSNSKHTALRSPGCSGLYDRSGCSVHLGVPKRSAPRRSRPRTRLPTQHGSGSAELLMQGESDASSNRVASILRMYLAGSFALLVGHSRSEARFDYWDSRRAPPPSPPFPPGDLCSYQAAEAPKFERLPLCLWYCCMHYILPSMKRT